MSNNALMNKSKNELVEIILRKDDVERNLRNQIKDLTNLNAELEKQLSVRTEFHQQVAERTSCLKHLLKTIRKINKPF